MKARVLIVEDDPALQDLLTYNLKQEFFDTTIAATGKQAFVLLQTKEYDLIILDLLLPEMDGTELLKEMRFEMGIPTPVIVLSAKGQLKDKLVGLDLGASDYITKPFELSELMARVKAHLRQTERLKMSLVDDGPKRRKIVTFGEVNVDRDARSMTKRGEEVYLRPKEFDLLVYLLERPGAVSTRRQIMDAVWGEDCPSGEKAVDVTMRTLREKVEDNPSKPRYLVTVRRAGYKFEF